MKERDFQTLSLFAILAFLTLLFVMGSRAVLFAPLADQNRQERRQTHIAPPILDSSAAQKSPIAP